MRIAAAHLRAHEKYDPAAHRWRSSPDGPADVLSACGRRLTSIYEYQDGGLEGYTNDSFFNWQPSDLVEVLPR